MDTPTNIVTIPRLMLEEVFIIAICAQQRADHRANEVFPSHRLMDIIKAKDALHDADTIILVDPLPLDLHEAVPWEKDSLLSKDVDTAPHGGNGSA
jgi:hypothetical protein